MWLSSNRIFYVIRRRGSSGFFSNFFFVLGNLIHARRHDLIPVVDMLTSPTLYNELQPVNGVRNNWEYYFEPVSGYTVDGVAKHVPHTNIRYSSGEFNTAELPWYYSRKPSKNIIASVQPILKQYIRLKPAIAAAHQDNMQRLAGRRVLGVHYRGTDIYTEYRLPALNWWVTAAKRAFITGRFDAVFLATDERAAVDAFKSVFGNRLIMNNSLRAPRGSRTGVHLNNSKPLRQKGVRYKLGKDVLLDMLALSECDSLICGYSNVAMAAIMFNGNRYRKVVMPHGTLK